MGVELKLGDILVTITQLFLKNNTIFDKIKSILTKAILTKAIDFLKNSSDFLNQAILQKIAFFEEKKSNDF